MPKRPNISPGLAGGECFVVFALKDKQTLRRPSELRLTIPPLSGAELLEVSVSPQSSLLENKKTIYWHANRHSVWSDVSPNAFGHQMHNFSRKWENVCRWGTNAEPLHWGCQWRTLMSSSFLFELTMFPMLGKQMIKGCRCLINVVSCQSVPIIVNQWLLSCGAWLTCQPERVIPTSVWSEKWKQDHRMKRSRCVNHLITRGCLSSSVSCF